MKLNFVWVKKQVCQPVVIFTLGFVCVVLLLSLFDTWIGSALEFDREKILQGELWRVLTGHYVHFGFYHSVMNMLSVTLIGLCLFWIFPLWVWLGLLVVVPLMDGLGLFFLSRDIDVYRGYSGAVYGLAIVGLILNWRMNPLIAGIVMLGLLGKLAYERLPGYDINFLINEIGVPVAVDAHLWGGITGVVLSIPLWYILRDLLPTYKKN